MLKRGTALAAMAALCLLFAAGCGSDEGASEAAAPTAAPEPSPASLTPEQQATADHIRARTFDLWDAYNTHNADALEEFYEPAYWQQEEGGIRRNMLFFSMSNRTITGEETQPPTETAPGRWETRHTAKYTGGEIYTLFVYEEFGGVWLLTHVENS